MQTAQAEVARTLFTLRVVFGAMIAGILVFGALVVFVLRPEPGHGDSDVLLFSLAVLAPVLVGVGGLVGRIRRQRLRAGLAEANHDKAAAVLHRGFFSISLVGAAMVEAYCFFGLVVHLMTASPLALVAVALALLMLAYRLPTADRFHRFAEELMGHGPA